MVQLWVTDQAGTEHAMDVAAGGSLMEAIRDAGLPIAAQCGGCCGCATCHVYVEQDWSEVADPMGADEKDMLELAEGVTEASRLSCQIRATAEMAGMRIALAPGTIV